MEQHKKCVRCKTEMVNEFDTGKSIVLPADEIKVLTQYDIDNGYLGYEVGDVFPYQFTTEKLPWCNVPECPNYKLLQIGE